MKSTLVQIQIINAELNYTYLIIQKKSTTFPHNTNLTLLLQKQQGSKNGDSFFQQTLFEK